MTVSIKNLKTLYPVGKGVPVITLTDPFEVNAMMRLLGLEKKFRRDLLEFVDAMDKGPHATMLLMYPSELPGACQAQVIAVITSHGPGKVTGKVTFVFHDQGCCALAKAFAEGYFNELRAALECIEGAKRWELGEKK